MTPVEAGWSALHEAVLGCNVARVKALLEGGADVHAETTDMLSSSSASSFPRPKGATIYGASVAKLGAQWSVSFDKGATPVHVASAVGSVALLELLQGAGAKVTALDGVGASALHHAAVQGHAEALAWLLKAKLKVDAATRIAKSIAFFDKGMTALHAALQSGSFEAFEVLLRAGADVKAITASGYNALFFAARGGEVRTLAALRDAGIAMNVAGTYMNNPLVEAVQGGHHDFAAALLASGFKAEDAPNGQQSALREATQRGDARMRQLLLDGGAKPLVHRGIADAAGANDIAAVREMLAAGADVNATLDGATPLMRACRDGYIEVAEVLLAAGARLDAEGKRHGPLHLAIEGNHHALALRLIEAGANVDAQDPHGNTPLFVAVMRRGTEACIEAMIARGANPYQRMRHGNWAMKFAKESAPARVALLEKTKHRDDPNATGWMPPDVASTTLTFKPGARWQDTLNQLFEQLVPPSGAANSVQGELVRASNKLVDEAMRNGNGNFDAYHRGLAKVLERLLTQPFSASEQAALQSDIKALTRGTLDGATHSRVAEAVVRWCQAHPKLIALGS